eukprot:jgi/Bigna1/78939/fgenesh1_pg.58_\
MKRAGRGGLGSGSAPADQITIRVQGRTGTMRISIRASETLADLKSRVLERLLTKGSSSSTFADAKKTTGDDRLSACSVAILRSRPSGDGRSEIANASCTLAIHDRIYVRRIVSIGHLLAWQRGGYENSPVPTIPSMEAGLKHGTLLYWGVTCGTTFYSDVCEQIENPAESNEQDSSSPAPSLHKPQHPIYEYLIRCGTVEAKLSNEWKDQLTPPTSPPKDGERSRQSSHVEGGRGLKVLELGAGVGLAGMVASICLHRAERRRKRTKTEGTEGGGGKASIAKDGGPMSSVVLTDGNVKVVRLLARNIARNKVYFRGAGEGRNDGGFVSLTCSHLEWSFRHFPLSSLHKRVLGNYTRKTNAFSSRKAGNEEHLKKSCISAGFDFVLGSNVLYSKMSAIPFFTSAARLLSPHGQEIEPHSAADIEHSFLKASCMMNCYA